MTPNEKGARLTSPTPGLHIALDPRIPDELERFPFRVDAGEEVVKVDWIVDEARIGSSDGSGASAFTYLWFPSRGAHSVRARVWREGSDLPVDSEGVSFVVK